MCKVQEIRVKKPIEIRDRGKRKIISLACHITAGVRWWYEVVV